MSLGILDHVVILVSHQTLANLPDWLSSALTIRDGGRHADGLTENKLVFFSDGTYIEFIAFVEGVSPDRRAAHRWGGRTEGAVIDWATTLLPSPDNPDASPEELFPELQSRVEKSQTRFRYSDPVGGGRVKPDGTELEWAISAPWRAPGADGDKTPVVRDLPFWCLDRTPRHLRVPYLDADATSHPCGATGFAGIVITAKGKKTFKAMQAAYSAVFGPGEVTEDMRRKVGGGGWWLDMWKVDTPSLTYPKSAQVWLSWYKDAEVELDFTFMLWATDLEKTQGHLLGDLDGKELEIRFRDQDERDRGNHAGMMERLDISITIGEQVDRSPHSLDRLI